MPTQSSGLTAVIIDPITPHAIPIISSITPRSSVVIEIILGQETRYAMTQSSNLPCPVPVNVPLLRHVLVGELARIVRPHRRMRVPPFLGTSPCRRHCEHRCPSRQCRDIVRSGTLRATAVSCIDNPASRASNIAKCSVSASSAAATLARSRALRNASAELMNSCFMLIALRARATQSPRRRRQRRAGRTENS